MSVVILDGCLVPTLLFINICLPFALDFYSRFILPSLPELKFNQMIFIVNIIFLCYYNNKKEIGASNVIDLLFGALL